MFRNLKLSERESVTLAFKRAGDVSKQAWKDLTVDIYYNPDPEVSNRSGQHSRDVELLNQPVPRLPRTRAA